MALRKYSLMQYDLSVLIHHVFVRPFCGRLKSLGFSSLYKTPKRVSICKKMVIIESLNFELIWYQVDFADKYQTTVHYSLLKVRISQKRRSASPVYC